MILIINLLIAIMSDTYSQMSDLNVGLYWAQVIKEMPKYHYHREYGALVMLPFIFSWIGFFLMPFLYCVKNKKVLANVNEAAFKFVFGAQAILIICLFILVNLSLVPFAYLKTIAHKTALLYKYRRSLQWKNLGIFFLFGIPSLICSQFTNLYQFLKHMFKAKQQRQQERLFEQ